MAKAEQLKADLDSWRQRARDTAPGDTVDPTHTLQFCLAPQMAAARPTANVAQVGPWPVLPLGST